MGININDECQDFTGQILRGEKTIETRKTRSLDPYIGERVGLVRTGVGKATLVGYATIGEPVVYDSVAKFRRDYDKHLVAPGSAFDIKDGLKYGYPLMQVEAVDPRQVESRGIVARRLNPYTRPDLRERLKRKIMAGSKGGNPGQWSARKAQLLAAEYEKAGGGYTGKRSASQRSLSKWTKEDWRTKSGKPSLETGERYLPAAAITALTSAEYAETSRAKRKATGQFSRQPKRIAMKTSEFRNPKDPRSAMTQITGTEDTYINASKMLGGKVLDYGAGRGIGTDALRSNGLLADSFEPFPENWEGKRPPTYTDSANIPSDSYDSLVSFSVINVVDPDERKFLFQEVARILRPDGVALITGRDRQDVQKATTKIPHLEEGGYLIGKGKLQRYQKGFTQAELERYAKEVLGPGFTVEANRALNGASIKITKGKPNPAKRNAVRSKLSRIIEPGDRILCYDTASGEDFYRLWDVIHTAMPMTKEALVEVEGMLDDDGVLVIESGETPAGLQDHFRRATRYNGLLLVQGPKNPEQARIETEKLRRELE
jgi:SAM-dependent methyltransferase